MGKNLKDSPNDKHYTYCLRCGRRLRGEESRKRGYGKVCWEKRILDNQENLF